MSSKMANPPPQIGGVLRDTINSLGFGLIVTVLIVNFSKLFISNFFVYITGTVFSIEVLLFSLYKPNTADIEVYREPGRRGRLRVESGSDEFTDTTSAQPSPSKKNPGGKKKDKQTKKAEKEKDKYHPVIQHGGAEKKRESLTVVTNAPVEAGSDQNAPTTPASPTGEKSNTWKRKLGHKWETYKEKREEKKADKEKDRDPDNENQNKILEQDQTKKEEDVIEEKERVEPKDEKIEDVALMDTKEKKSQENVDNKEEDENKSHIKDDPFDEDFGDEDEDRKEKPKMKLKWPKKRPKSTGSE